jgi:DNA-binding NarL/FixJ family response regulator
VSPRWTGRQERSLPLAIEIDIEDLQLAERVGRMISERPGLRLTLATDGAEPDLTITDVTTERASVLRAIVLTDRAGVVDALQAGALGVLADDCDGEALHAAIRSAMQGLTTVSAEFRTLVVDEGHALGALPDDVYDIGPPAVDLTARELEVLHLLAEGASNKLIARRLEITPLTAKFHVASIVAKLGAIGRTDAVAKAMRLGLVMI